MQTIFITGAGSGIGRVAAQRFADLGWRVAATDISASSLDTLKEELGDVHFYQVLDVTNDTEVTAVLSEFANLNDGKLDVLLNNAGILFDGAFEEIALSDHHKLVEVNVLGLQNCAHVAFPYLKAAQGTLINMGSASAAFGIPNIAAYSASKFFVRGLTEALSIEWQKHGIQVSEITPGIVKTNMTDSASTTLFEQYGVNLVPSQVVDQIVSAATSTSTKFRWPVDGILDLAFRKVLVTLPARVQQFFVKRMLTIK